MQRDALTEAGCKKIFIEQMSGAVTDRPELMAALGFMFTRIAIERDLAWIIRPGLADVA
jgi:hypothetical protein